MSISNKYTHLTIYHLHHPYPYAHCIPQFYPNIFMHHSIKSLSLRFTISINILLQTSLCTNSTIDYLTPQSKLEISFLTLRYFSPSHDHKSRLIDIINITPVCEASRIETFTQPRVQPAILQTACISHNYHSIARAYIAFLRITPTTKRTRTKRGQLNRRKETKSRHLYAS